MEVTKPKTRDGNFFECDGFVHTDVKQLIVKLKGRNDLVLQHRVDMFFMHGFELGNKQFAKKSDRKKVTVKDCKGKSFTFSALGQLGRLDHPKHKEFKEQLPVEE